ncbi:MAG: hypothetical protein KDA24_08945 [Deltaproteobacteria bacterium]|nr:hypothetical protein [Deltaproteobacteria bacterium]
MSMQTRRFSAPPFALLVLLALGVIPLASCGGGGSSSDPGSALGQSGGDDAIEQAMADKEVLREAFDLSRATLYGTAPGSETDLSALPGRRAFVCVYGVERPNICGTGTGATLADSVRAAAEQLKSTNGNAIAKAQKAGSDVRIKIDIVRKVKDRNFKRAIEKPKKREVGIYGYWVTHEGASTYILPSEVLEQSIFSSAKKTRGIPRKNVVKALKRRESSMASLPEEFPYTRLYTSSWVEGDPAGKETPDIVRTYRMHRWDFDDLNEDLLLQRTVWAADYLVSSITAEGKIRYQYYVAKDRDSNSYNLLRHGGTTYSILQAYDRTKYEPYRLASEQAIKFLFSKCREDERTGPFGGGPTKWILSPGNKVKLGGAGLALVMLDQYGEATGDYETYKDDAIKFGNFIVASLKEDGEFIYFPAMKPGGPPTDTDDSAYYPGEAILGLLRLHAWNPDEKWLNTARAASDWLIDVRDAGKTEKSLANDHWLMIALSYLYQATKDEKYLDHSLNLARAVQFQYEKNRPMWKDYRDFQGGYYNPPRSTPAATRGEGLVAVTDTCRVAGKECDWVWDLLLETIRHENLSQYDPDMMWWVKNKKKAFGGWDGGLIDTSIRNDFVQHNMSAVIGTERNMAFKARGDEYPGGPIWSRLNIDEGRTWPGVDPAKMQELREASQRYRGDTLWEKRWKEELAAKAATPETPDAPEGSATP